MPDSVPEEALGPVRSVTGGAGVEGGPAIVSARPRRRAPRRPVCGRRCHGWDRLATRGRLGGPGSRRPRAPRTSRGDRGRRSPARAGAAAAGRPRSRGCRARRGESGRASRARPGSGSQAPAPGLGGERQGQGRDRAELRVPRHRQPHRPRDARVLGPEANAAGRGGGDVISTHTNSRSLRFGSILTTTTCRAPSVAGYGQKTRAGPLSQPRPAKP